MPTHYQISGVLGFASGQTMVGALSFNGSVCAVVPLSESPPSSQVYSYYGTIATPAAAAALPYLDAVRVVDPATDTNSASAMLAAFAAATAVSNQARLPGLPELGGYLSVDADGAGAFHDAVIRQVSIVAGSSQ